MQTETVKSSDIKYWQEDSNFTWKDSISREFKFNSKRGTSSEANQPCNLGENKRAIINEWLLTLIGTGEFESERLQICKTFILTVSTCKVNFQIKR